MQVGDVYYLKSDGSKYTIVRFRDKVYSDDIAVLFNTGDMIDSFTLLNSNLFVRTPPTTRTSLSIETPVRTSVFKYEESDRSSYNGQHEGYVTSHELPYWREEDLVPNPK